jgi:hypothetical protein
VTGVPVSWGTPLDAAAWDGAVIRTATDYIDDPRSFLAWCEETARRIPLANPPAVLAWNSDKRYLRDLAEAGVATVPTLWIGPGESLDSVPWARFVVKPAVSAGARSSASYEAAALSAARRHVEAIAGAGGVAMVQPHLPSIDAEGEVGVYVIGGEITHAITKTGVLRPGVPPRADLSLARGQRSAPAPIPDGHAAFARAVLGAVPGGPRRVLYARVDVARGEAGELLLLELECIEPHLFLEHAPGQSGAVAAAFAAWLERRGEAGPAAA